MDNELTHSGSIDGRSATGHNGNTSDKGRSGCSKHELSPEIDEALRSASLEAF